LNRSKTQSPLIVIDPVQPDRNAAAALGEEKFELFRKRAAEFLRSPSKRFFVQEKIDIQEIIKKAGDAKTILLDVESGKGKEDVVGAKLLKTLQFIEKQLKMNCFNVKSTGWKWDKKKKAVFWIAVDKEDLSRKAIWEGPPVKATSHYERFKSVHKKTFEKDGKIYAEVDRKFVNAERFIKHLMKDEYIKERVKSISLR
ncbi:MAG: hypothetical protein KKE20_01085, partial [Nanoarchaeota archaeon]|nr:hypothetical protein [Nanoarchaeota archaeon]